MNFRTKRASSSFWVANGSGSTILVKPSTDELVLLRLQLDVGYSVSGEAKAEGGGCGVSAGAGIGVGIKKDQRGEFERMCVEHGFVPVGHGKVLPFEGEFVTIRDSSGDPICGNYKVKQSCSVIVDQDKTIQVSAPIKTDRKGKVDDYKLWQSFDGTDYYGNYYNEQCKSGGSHKGVYCDKCGQQGIVGARWKCRVCADYDLCSTCYISNYHDLTHAFMRFDRPDSSGVLIEPRQKKETKSKVELNSGSTKKKEAESKDSSASQRPHCVAVYDYDAEEDDEISIKEGDVLELVEHHEGWSIAKLNGRVGLIPINYVKVIVDLPDNSTSQKPSCEALYPYKSRSGVDLSFEPGDVMELLCYLDDTWLIAELKGRKGMVPRNYAKIIVDRPHKEGKLDTAVFRYLFEMIDTDNKGYVTPDEIKYLMQLYLSKPVEDMLGWDSFLASLDTNGDGKISLKELMNCMENVK